MRKFSWIERIFALRARKFRHPAKFGRLPGAGQRGPVMGLRPLLGPLCTPPGAPPLGFQLPWDCEGTRLVLRELPSLAAFAQVISLCDA